MEFDEHLESTESFIFLQSFFNNMCELSSLTNLTVNIANKFIDYAGRLYRKDGGTPRTTANGERE